MLETGVSDTRTWYQKIFDAVIGGCYIVVGSLVETIALILSVPLALIGETITFACWLVQAAVELVCVVAGTVFFGVNWWCYCIPDHDNPRRYHTFWWGYGKWFQKCFPLLYRGFTAGIQFLAAIATDMVAALIAKGVAKLHGVELKEHAEAAQATREQAREGEEDLVRRDEATRESAPEGGEEALVHTEDAAEHRDAVPPRDADDQTTLLSTVLAKFGFVTGLLILVAGCIFPPLFIVNPLMIGFSIGGAVLLGMSIALGVLIANLADQKLKEQMTLKKDDISSAIDRCVERIKEAIIDIVKKIVIGIAQCVASAAQYIAAQFVMIFGSFVATTLSVIWDGLRNLFAATMWLICKVLAYVVTYFKLIFTQDGNISRDDIINCSTFLFFQAGCNRFRTCMGLGKAPSDVLNKVTSVALTLIQSAAIYVTGNTDRRNIDDYLQFEAYIIRQERNRRIIFIFGIGFGICGGAFGVVVLTNAAFPQLLPSVSSFILNIMSTIPFPGIIGIGVSIIAFGVSIAIGGCLMKKRLNKITEVEHALKDETALPETSVEFMGSNGLPLFGSPIDRDRINAVKEHMRRYTAVKEHMSRYTIDPIFD